MPPTFLMTDPAHFDVSYQINPWMRPDAWSKDPASSRKQATRASKALKKAIEAIGGRVETIGAIEGLPDLVFPANAAIVLDRKVLLARFRCKERQGEEAIFRAAFHSLKRRGWIDEIFELPDGVFQEGAGDCIWDAERQLFWIGYGQRSTHNCVDAIESVFAKPMLALELATPRFYHLDTCFCPLSGGEVLYYPEAFTAQSLAMIRAQLPKSQRLEASEEEASAFCVNAVSLGRDIVMAKAPSSLKAKLLAKGYRLHEVDLAPFILSGGAAYCMTLRLDRSSGEQTMVRAAE